jgi:hypothetical protein
MKDERLFSPALLLGRCMLTIFKKTSKMQLAVFLTSRIWLPKKMEKNLRVWGNALQLQFKIKWSKSHGLNS